MLVKMGSKMQNLALKASYLPVVRSECTKDLASCGLVLEYLSEFPQFFLLFNYI